MKTLILYTLLLTSFTFATSHNIFIIKDKNGKVLKGKRINHIKNVYYDDLIKEQNEILKQLDKLEERRDKLTQSALDYNKKNMLKNAKKYLGGRYIWGGTHPKGFDCSGYTQYIYKKEGVTIPRTANEQAKVGKEVSRFELQKGDLLFFLTDRLRNIPITHVGMYLGNYKFIHAASKRTGIIISSLNKSKYSRLFVKATRIIK